MLGALQNNLEASAKRQSLQIRDREIELFAANLRVLAQQSAFLSGLMWAALCLADFDPKNQTNNGPAVVYYLASCFGLCFCVLSTLVASLTTILGPGLAIRGPDGSMQSAAEGMKYFGERALLLFGTGLVLALCSAMSLVWLKLGGHVPMMSALLNAISAVFLGLLAYYSKFIFKYFKIEGDFDRVDEYTFGGGFAVETAALSSLYDKPRATSAPARANGKAEEQSDATVLKGNEINVPNLLNAVGTWGTAGYQKHTKKIGSIRWFQSKAVEAREELRDEPKATSEYRVLGLVDCTEDGLPESVVIDTTCNGLGNEICKLDFSSVKNLIDLREKLMRAKPVNAGLLDTKCDGYYDCVILDSCGDGKADLLVKLEVPLRAPE